MADNFQTGPAPGDENRVSGRLTGALRQLSLFVAAHKASVSVVSGIFAIAFIGVVLWTTGFLTGDEQQSAVVTRAEPSRPETSANAPRPDGPILPVTSVPTDPECSRKASSSSTTQPLDVSAIEDVALTGVVEILTDVGTGSGLVAGAAGLIVTDSQVVEGSWLIKVPLASGETTKGELFGISEGSGVAYIEIVTNETLTALPLGNSDGVCVGDEAFAVGYQQSPSAEVGNYSAAEGRISAIRENYFWTDVPLDARGAGGPLIDTWGNVIGVTSSGIVITRDHVASATNFAIPINVIKQEINEGLDQSKLTTSYGSAPEPTESP